LQQIASTQQGLIILFCRNTDQITITILFDVVHNEVSRKTSHQRRPEILSTFEIPDPQTGAKFTLSLETKYGLRLRVSDSGFIRISSVHKKRKHEEIAHDDDDVYGCDSKLSTSVQPHKKRRHEEIAHDDVYSYDSEPVTDPNPVIDHFKYRIFPDWCTSYLWNQGMCLSPCLSPVEESNIEARYPRLAKFYFEWHDMFEDAFVRQECHLGSKLEQFPQVDELVAWATEGFLVVCWLALQANVKDAEYGPLTRANGYYLRKGRLEEELVRFLVDMEALLSAESPTG
jgi:hypothetical protein